MRAIILTIFLLAASVAQAELTATQLLALGVPPRLAVELVKMTNGSTRVIFSQGTAASPSATFTGDSNTGMYWVGADNLGFTTGGVAMLSVATSGVFVLQEEFYVPDGTAAAPSVVFNADQNTGMYRVGADNLGFSTNGVARVGINNGGLDVVGELNVTGTPTVSGVVCVKADGDYGQCTSVVAAGGTCTCG